MSLYRIRLTQVPGAPGEATVGPFTIAQEGVSDCEVPLCLYPAAALRSSGGTAVHSRHTIVHACLFPQLLQRNFVVTEGSAPIPKSGLCGRTFTITASAQNEAGWSDWSAGQDFVMPACP